MKFRLFVKSLGVLPLFVILNSCSSGDKPLAPVDRAAIQSVGIDQSIAKPAKMTYFDSGDAMMKGVANQGLIGSLIGSAIEPLATSGPKGDEIQAAAIANRVNIEPIVWNTFSRQLAVSGLFPVANEGTADTICRLEVISYGLQHPGGFTRKVAPMVDCRMSLEKKGKVVFRQTSGPVFADEAYRAYAQNFKANPQLLRSGWENAAQQSAIRLFQKI